MMEIWILIYVRFRSFVRFSFDPSVLAQRLFLFFSFFLVGFTNYQDSITISHMN